MKRRKRKMDKKMILFALIFSLILIGGTAFAADQPQGIQGGVPPLTIQPPTRGLPTGTPEGAPKGTEQGGVPPLTATPNTLGSPMGTPAGAPPTTEQGGVPPLTIQPNTLGSPMGGK
jgi:hypothetical protein